jgi:hypothetical protein
MVRENVPKVRPPFKFLHDLAFVFGAFIRLFLGTCSGNALLKALTDWHSFSISQLFYLTLSPLSAPSVWLVCSKLIMCQHAGCSHASPEISVQCANLFARLSRSTCITLTVFVSLQTMSTGVEQMRDESEEKGGGEGTDKPALSDDRLQELTNLLVTAARAGDVAEGLRLVEQGADINRQTDQDTEGDTPLTAACNEGKPEFVHFLLDQRGLDPNAWNKYEAQPLERALRGSQDHWRSEGCNRAAELLIARPDVWVNPFYKNQTTLLTLSIEMGNNRIAELLLARQDIDVNTCVVAGLHDNNPLTTAVEAEDQELVEALLSHPHIIIDHPNEDGGTALERALEIPVADSVIPVLLAAHGADVHDLQEQYDTPGTVEHTYLQRGDSARASVLALLALRKVQVEESLEAARLPSAVGELVVGYDAQTSTEALSAWKQADPAGWAALLMPLDESGEEEDEEGDEEGDPDEEEAMDEEDGE